MYVCTLYVYMNVSTEYRSISVKRPSVSWRQEAISDKVKCQARQRQDHQCQVSSPRAWASPGSNGPIVSPVVSSPKPIPNHTSQCRSHQFQMKQRSAIPKQSKQGHTHFKTKQSQITSFQNKESQITPNSKTEQAIPNQFQTKQARSAIPNQSQNKAKQDHTHSNLGKQYHRHQTERKKARSVPGATSSRRPDLPRRSDQLFRAQLCQRQVMKRRALMALDSANENDQSYRYSKLSLNRNEFNL